MSQDNTKDSKPAEPKDAPLTHDPEKTKKDAVPSPDSPEGQAYADYLAKRVADFVESLDAVMFPRPGEQVVDTKGYVRAYPPTIHVQPKSWWDNDEEEAKDKKDVKDEEPAKPKPGTAENQG